MRTHALMSGALDCILQLSYYAIPTTTTTHHHHHHHQPPAVTPRKVNDSFPLYHNSVTTLGDNMCVLTVIYLCVYVSVLLGLLVPM